MIMQLEFESHSMLYHLINFAFIFAHDHEPFFCSKRVLILYF